jgi:hypothetical protein
LKTPLLKYRITQSPSLLEADSDAVMYDHPCQVLIADDRSHCSKRKQLRRIVGSWVASARAYSSRYPFVDRCAARSARRRSNGRNVAANIQFVSRPPFVARMDGVPRRRTRPRSYGLTWWVAVLDALAAFAKSVLWASVTGERKCKHYGRTDAAANQFP